LLRDTRDDTAAVAEAQVEVDVCAQEMEQELAQEVVVDFAELSKPMTACLQ
jgi:hypothetical protein